MLAGRLRHWDGDLAGASAAYQEALAAEPDPATAATAQGFLGALLEHSDRFDDARRVLGQAVVACQRTGALRPPAAQQAALDRLTRALPAELRTGFASRGRLATQLAARA